jgi:hypothetical protein
MFPGPWGHGSGLEGLGSKFRQSGNFCVAGGMGREDYYGMTAVGISVGFSIQEGAGDPISEDPPVADRRGRAVPQK